MGRPLFGSSLKVPLLRNLGFFIGSDVVSSHLGKGGVAQANEHELHFLSFYSQSASPTSEEALMKISL